MKQAKVNRRGEILAAARKLMQSRGLSGVTTRQIAEAVGCSEGALYVHFQGRAALLIAVLEESLPQMLGPVHALRDLVGQETPQRNLERALRGMLAFHRKVVPMIAGLFAEPELLSAYRKTLARGGKGPHRAISNLADYILAEQASGRIRPDVDAHSSSALLMSASFFRVFTERFFGVPVHPPLDRFVQSTVASVL